MNIKDKNEITVKITCSKEELIKLLKEKGVEQSKNYSLSDYYFIPKNLDINSLSTREIISKSVIIRDISNDRNITKKITYKIKEFNNNGDILNQKAINCSIYDIEEAKNLLEAIGYEQIMNIKEDDLVLIKGELEFTIKDIKNGDVLIEIEENPNSENYDTIDKLKLVVEDLKIPIEPNEFFIKKAEIELNKILDR